MNTFCVTGAACGTCDQCVKIKAGSHPDFFYIGDDALKVDRAREIIRQASQKPSEAECQIFVIDNADNMRPEAQNALLKVIEEPQSACFVFLCLSRLSLLPTVRSRCVEWNLGDEDQAASAGDSRAEELCALLDRRDTLGLAAFFTDLETRKISREELQSLLEHTWELVGQSLLAASGCGGRNLCPHLSRRQLSAAADVLRDAAAQLRFNLGVGHMAGALAVLLHERTGR